VRLTAEQLQPALDRGLAAVYLVSGDEPLLVGEAADAIRAAARARGYADRTVFFVDRSFDWDDLKQSTQSLSLFAERRLFELRMPTGKPDKGAAALIDLATRPPPDVLCLIVTDKLDNKTGDAAWVRAIEKHGAWVRVWPVDTAALPGWLRARAKTLKIEIEPDAARIIATLVEGNLLAAKQELDKLALLAGGARIDAALVLRSVGDSARYDVFQLASAAAAGDAQRALKVLLGLKSEGVEPTLILWALLRELRGLWQARERIRLKSNTRGSGWNQAATPSPEAQARIATLPLAPLLRQAHQTDRVIKGLAAGDSWTAITGLTAAMAGALQASAESGRVSV
jgi:DNA polymerase-3 subunit delta